MEFLQCHYFLVVAKYEHMTRAAEVLHVAQPALSQCIRRLEEELGVKLFERQGRRIYLNECGKLLQKRLRPIMAALESIQPELDMVAKRQEQAIRLNVSAGSTIVTEILIHYQEKRPQARFHLMQNAQEEEWDISLSTAPDATQGRSGDAVFNEEIFLAVPNSSPLAMRPAVRLDELVDERFISLAGSRQLRAICDDLCDSVGFVPNIVFESDSPMMVRKLIEAGTGVSFWPAYSWGQFRSERAQLISIGSPICRRKLIVRMSRHAVDAEACMDFYGFMLSWLQALESGQTQWPGQGES